MAVSVTVAWSLWVSVCASVSSKSDGLGWQLVPSQSLGWQPGNGKNNNKDVNLELKWWSNDGSDASKFWVQPVWLHCSDSFLVNILITRGKREQTFSSLFWLFACTELSSGNVCVLFADAFISPVNGHNVSTVHIPLKLKVSAITS